MVHTRSDGIKTGFTIVELLIVIVIIALLAAITVVGYQGITKRAKETAIKSDLTSFAKKLEVAKSTSSSDTYPATLTDVGLLPKTEHSYYGTTASGKGFCLDTYDYDEDTNVPYMVSSQSPNPVIGACGTFNGLVGYYPLDGDAQGAAGNDNNGQAVNTSSAIGVKGLSGGALAFNGSSSQVMCGLDSSLRRTDTFTVTAWVNLTAAPTANVGIVDNGSGGTQGYSIYVNPSRQIRATLHNRGVALSPSGIDLGRWYFVSVRFDTGRVNFDLVYMSGTSLASNGGTMGSVGSGTISGYSASPCQIGSIRNQANSYLSGTIDDVRIYNRALSNDEMINNVYSQSSTMFAN